MRYTHICCFVAVEASVHVIYLPIFVHVANMGPTWALSAPDGPHVGPMNLTIRDVKIILDTYLLSIEVSFKPLKCKQAKF